jgi:hypothetical protein
LQTCSDGCQAFALIIANRVELEIEQALVGQRFKPVVFRAARQPQGCWPFAGCACTDPVCGTFRVVDLCLQCRHRQQWRRDTCAVGLALGVDQLQIQQFALLQKSMELEQLGYGQKDW